MGEILSIHWTCALELPPTVRHSSSLSEVKPENPSLPLCILMCHFTSPSPVIHVIVVCVCLSVCARASVCVCDKMSVSLYFCKHSGLLQDGAP